MKYFTLIELLVVVAVISILASMLMPSLASSREKAREAYCKANMKNQGAGMHIWIDDAGDDRFPYAYWDVFDGTGWKPWYERISQQTGQPVTQATAADDDTVFTCPSRDRTTASYHWESASYGYQWVWLGYWNEDSATYRRPSVGDIKSPSTMIMVTDSNGDQSWDAFTHHNNNAPPGTRHRNGSNVLLIDGHIEWSTPLEMMAGNGASGMPHFKNIRP